MDGQYAMRTDLRSLEMLLAVVDQGSIGGAARALQVAQPSVTNRIKRLERHLGLTLIVRSPRGCRLTDEGVAVADWAREVLGASDQLETGVAALRRNHDSQLSVSASLTVAEYLLPRWLADLRLRSPETGVALRMCNSEQAAQDVLHGAADLGFIEGPRTTSGLHARVVAVDDLVIVVAPGHPWSRRRRPLTVAELAATPLIAREKGSGTRDTLDHALARAGAEGAAAPRLELASTAAIRTAVLTGQGVGVLSRFAISDDIRGGRLREVAVEDVDLRRRLRAIWRSGSQLSGPAADLTHCALQSSWGRPAQGRTHRPARTKAAKAAG
ncbi:LysR family transcriptional regulator [Streptomyces sp. NPDC014733]|uniref:LysR family transcriptional regulator n=1 Tax=Streptomyces sp. NPDC014733 TaxID=3364885 RepID=UPI003702632B